MHMQSIMMYHSVLKVKEIAGLSFQNKVATVYVLPQSNHKKKWYAKQKKHPGYKKCEANQKQHCKQVHRCDQKL